MDTLKFSTLTLSFLDKKAEDAYRNSKLSSDVSLLKYLSLFAFIVMMIYSIKDFFFTQNIHPDIVLFRMYVMTPVMLLVFLISLTKWATRHFNNLYLLSVFMMLSLILGQYYLTAANDNLGSSFAKTLPLIIFSTYLFSGIKFKQIIVFTPCFFISFLIVITYFEDMPSSEKINDIMLVTMNLMLAIFFKYVLEENRRKTYMHQLVIEGSEIKLEENLKNEKVLSTLRKDLIALLAHDIRGPLTNLKGVISLLNAKKISSEKGEELLSQVRERIDLIIKGVNDLLIWVRSKEAGRAIEVTKFNVEEFIQEILEIGKIDMEEKKIKVINQIESGLELSTDKGALQTILRNLLSNAMKFSHKGANIYINSKANKDEVFFEVKDEGTGMDKGVIKKVLESFYTTDGTEKEKGIGLGLQICFGLLEKLESKLKIESIAGQGTIMSFSLKQS